MISRVCVASSVPEQGMQVASKHVALALLDDILQAARGRSSLDQCSMDAGIVNQVKELGVHVLDAPTAQLQQQQNRSGLERVDVLALLAPLALGWCLLYPHRSSAGTRGEGDDELLPEP